MQSFISQVLGREQREEARLAQLKESAATEKMEKAAFIIFLKGEDLLNMMFDVHKEKEELLLKMPQAKGRFFTLQDSSLNEISETLAGFRTEFLGILKQLYELGLSELKQREAERLDIEVDNWHQFLQPAQRYLQGGDRQGEEGGGGGGGGDHRGFCGGRGVGRPEALRLCRAGRFHPHHDRWFLHG